MLNEYDPFGGHTKEEADAAYENLFRELHGEGLFEETEQPFSIYVLIPASQNIDAVCASIGYAYLMNKLNPAANYIPCVSDSLTDETSRLLDYFEKLSSASETQPHPILIEQLSDENFLPDTDIVLMGHNKPNVSLKDFNQERIVEIIDCHGLQGFESEHILRVNIMPFGSVSTMISQMFRENAVAINAYYASILCAGIMSETDNFLSKSTTKTDRIEAVVLANTAGISIEEFYREIVEIGGTI